MKCQYIPLEYYPSDSRVKIIKDGVSQTLRRRFGTGGGNVPIVIVTTTGLKQLKPICYRKTAHPTHSGGGQGYEETKVNDTLNVFDNSEARASTIILVFDARGNGKGVICPTITGVHQNFISDYTAIVVETNDGTKTDNTNREEIL